MEFVKRQQYSQQWLIQLPATYQIFFFFLKKKACPAFVNANAEKHFTDSCCLSWRAMQHAHGLWRPKSPPLRICSGCVGIQRVWHSPAWRERKAEHSTAHHRVTTLQGAVSSRLCHGLASPGHRSHLPFFLHGTPRQF